MTLEEAASELCRFARRVELVTEEPLKCGLLDEIAEDMRDTARRWRQKAREAWEEGDDGGDAQGGV